MNDLLHNNAQDYLMKHDARKVFKSGKSYWNQDI